MELPIIVLTKESGIAEATWNTIWNVLKDPRIWAVTMINAFFSGIGTALGAGVIIGVFGKKVLDVFRRILRLEEKRK